MIEATSPLVVDLDGSLIRNDTSYELFMLCVRWAPLMLPYVIYKFLVSRSKAKRFLAIRFADKIDPTHLPYERAVLDTITRYREAGQPVELVSGSDDILVKNIANHLGVFTLAQGSTPARNLVSRAKAEFIRERYNHEFVYIGNSHQDMAVWRQARGGYGVRAPKEAQHLHDADGVGIPIQTLVERSSPWPALLRAMRLHQWSKNLLLFVIPGMLLTSLTPVHMGKATLAFGAFCLVASATYLLNDLFDLGDDRAHARKHVRPLPSGELSIPLAAVAIVVLGLLGFILAICANPKFLILLVVYTFATLAYSFRLKRLAVVDVLLLAFLFCIRVVAGAAVIGAIVTAWFLSFISLFFLSLAIAKRVIEVQTLADGESINGRGYMADDKLILTTFGAATGVGAILSFMIFGLISENAVFNDPMVTLGAGVVMLGWLLRLWLLVGRGEVDGDPVLFAIKDKTSFACLALAGLIVSFETAEAWWAILF